MCFKGIHIVLGRISKCCKMRIFCANFLSWNIHPCYIFTLLHLWDPDSSMGPLVGHQRLFLILPAQLYEHTKKQICSAFTYNDVYCLTFCGYNFAEFTCICILIEVLSDYHDFADRQYDKRADTLISFTNVFAASSTTSSNWMWCFFLRFSYAVRLLEFPKRFSAAKGFRGFSLAGAPTNHGHHSLLTFSEDTFQMICISKLAFTLSANRLKLKGSLRLRLKDSLSVEQSSNKLAGNPSQLNWAELEWVAW